MPRFTSITPRARHAAAIIALAGAALGSAAFAQQPAAAAATAGPLPAAQTQGALRYACGGIGIDESTAMRAAMKDHPLSLLFAAAGGAYQADVQVTLRPEGQGAGQPLTFTANGPICLLTVPAGTYAVEASANGQQKRQSVTVGQGAKTLDFRF
ncbi:MULTISPECIES: carboxypeptidase regulatory-like domain-containing protein [unclassified Acidovorax]|uniref:carboxypeptidase regulatory-like domain-containing protein n=1 Tax=unclassified Acidovorax TaxID=2684926 RepID=UPI0028831D00|nr:MULTISPECIES: carboxypeptidase regulatory-like domain-containing protein [unclassified Acidovorax]